MGQRNQRTILREATVKGKGLHTGAQVNLTLKPAEENSGIVFKRTDIYGKPEIKPDVSQVTDLVRSTTISNGNNKIHTIEHVLSALSGMAIDNAIIEIDSGEPPILDGSSKHFVNMIQEAEPVEQTKSCKFCELTEPVTVTDGNRSIIALPYDGLKITCTSADDRGIHTQHLSIDIDPETYMAQIAPARTFTIYEDIEPLLKMGKIQGGSLDSAIVIKGDKIISKEPLRFKDEFVRHKILDIIGDISLLGMPLKAHIIAVRPGHTLNAMLTQKIKEQLSSPKKKQPAINSNNMPEVIAKENHFNIRRILDIMPHRYPFVLIDRVLELKSEDELVALKNVTFNEPFFQGHFPGNPVMPGVLQVEAMAQAAGLLLLQKVDTQNKIAYFMSCDKVKFRKAVTPGDQLEIHVKMTKVKESRGNMIGVATGECKVNGQTVSSADLMFTVAEAEE